jgi:malonyl-CoA O-methyltransferase
LTFDELLQRLSPVVIQPRKILDLGCATGAGSRQLASRYRRSSVFGMDASIAMLQQARKRRALFARPAMIQGDACRIPLQSGSIDLVFANMLLPWIDDYPACLSEIARVLRKDGVFAFATFGPDSLSEIRAAWHSVDEDWHVNAYPDMHDIGDALVRAGLRDPVLDVDHLTVTYRDTAALYRDLTSAGARNCLLGRRRTLTGKSRFKAMDELLAALCKRSTNVLKRKNVRRTHRQQTFPPDISASSRGGTDRPVPVARSLATRSRRRQESGARPVRR